MTSSWAGNCLEYKNSWRSTCQLHSVVYVYVKSLLRFLTAFDRAVIYHSFPLDACYCSWTYTANNCLGLSIYLSLFVRKAQNTMNAVSKHSEQGSETTIVLNCSKYIKMTKENQMKKLTIKKLINNRFKIENEQQQELKTRLSRANAKSGSIYSTHRMLEWFKRWKFKWITRQTVPNINDTLCEEFWPHCTAVVSLKRFKRATTCTAKLKFKKCYAMLKRQD